MSFTGKLIVTQPGKLMSSSATQNPPKWWDVYQTDDECKVFKALARSADYKWRSTAALVTATGLTTKKVESIISRYLPTGVIVAHAKDAGMWQYWERGEVKEKKGSLTEEDQKKRLTDAAGSSPKKSKPAVP